MREARLRNCREFLARRPELAARVAVPDGRIWRACVARGEAAQTEATVRMFQTLAVVAAAKSSS
jgi:hypothetical protein